VSTRTGKFPVDGHELEWEMRGEGRPVALLHGLAISRQVMIDFCEPVLEHHALRRIYIDLPGHGGSEGNPAKMSADDLVDAMAAVLGELSAGEVPALLGYSYGGYLAQGLMRVLEPAGLFLACPTVEPDFGRRTVPSRRVAARDESLAFSDDPREKDAFEEVAVLQTAPMLERFQRVVHPANIAANQHAMALTRGRYTMSRPYAQALAAYEGPVSIVCGRDDHWVGWEDALRLARLMRRSCYSVLPDCGHLLPMEQPARFAALLADWVSRLA
jgi:pimeloyl-ACP methyl ester carboxylesterase